MFRFLQNAQKAGVKFANDLENGPIEDIKITYKGEALEDLDIFIEPTAVYEMVRVNLIKAAEIQTEVLNNAVKQSVKKQRRYDRDFLIAFIVLALLIFYIVPYLLFSLFSWTLSFSEWFLLWKILGILLALLGAAVIAMFIIEPPRDGM